MPAAPAAPRTVLAGLARIGMVLRAGAWAKREAGGLTPTQAQILALLAARAPAGLRLSVLAEELAVTAQSAGESVAALVAKGLVARSADAADGRASLLHLTAAGRRAAERGAEWPDLMLAAVDDLSEAEQALFLRALMKMIRGLQQRGAIPVQRMCASCRYFRPDAHPGSAQPHHCGFVDAPFGDGALRLDCPDHEAAEPALAHEIWRAFLARDPASPQATARMPAPR
ncbi:MAG: winged helix-turn-helix transcriptional regulator [Alphaproteobacteria bacterium]|nr:winged helix-turn-helix transcriptional regulator [Alphaproteobacteria bacterium]